MAKAKKGEAKAEGAKATKARRKAEPAPEATTAPAEVKAPKATPKPRAKKPETAAPAVDPATLRGPVDAAQAALAAAEAEAHEMTGKARALVNEAKDAYRDALVPYRDACRKAGIPCEFEGGRGANVSEKVSFEVEKVAKGIRVAVKGKPDTEEVIPLAALKESINREAYRYTDKHVGPREKVGNKGGSLSNRLRAALK